MQKRQAPGPFVVYRGSGMNPINAWFRRTFSDPQVVILGLALLVGLLTVLFFGRMLAPVLASMVLAYLLEGVVWRLERRKVPRLAGVMIVFSIFMLFILFVLFGLLPILSQQVGQLVQEIPTIIARGREELMRLPEDYPKAFSDAQVTAVADAAKQELASMGQTLLSLSVQGMRSLITVLIYLVLVPLMVFFLLKDKHLIQRWLTQFLPSERALTNQVLADVDLQLGNYVRGKVWEILIVWSFSYATFTLLELDFAMLLSLFVGLSVLVPYIGATVMTLPIALIGYYDYGWTSQLAWVLVAYGVIQLLDGNLLAPLLLSEVVNLHPIAIVVAVIFFGGLWGFWGVFFAIPLATLVQSVIKAWPRRQPRDAVT